MVVVAAADDEDLVVGVDDADGVLRRIGHEGGLGGSGPAASVGDLDAEGLWSG